MHTMNRQSYIVSREAKMLIAALVFCLAGWIWFNFFTQQRTLASQGVRSQAGAPTVLTVPPQTGDSAVTVNTPVATIPVDTTAVVVSAAPEFSEVEIFELPFLSTSPRYTPPALAEGGVAEGIVSGPASSSPISAGNRVAVNPFSPLIRPEEEVIAPVPTNIPPPVQQALGTSASSGNRAPVVVSAPPVSQGPSVGSEVRAPAPNALTPPPSFATALPRSLARGGLASMPRVLTRPTGAAPVAEVEPEPEKERPIPTAPDNLAQLVAVRQPNPVGTFAATTSATEDAITEVAVAGEVEAQPRPALPTVSSSQPQPSPAIRTSLAQEPPPPPPPPPAPVATSIPLPMPTVEVTRNPLDSYIEDNGLIFTGAVLGPVSIAVFRSDGQSFHIATGRTLPETDIILTNVTSEQAQVTLAGETRTLSLNPSLSARAREASN